jgi:hypothetical protein
VHRTFKFYTSHYFFHAFSNGLGPGEMVGDSILSSMVKDPIRVATFSLPKNRRLYICREYRRWVGGVYKPYEQPELKKRSLRVKTGEVATGNPRPNYGTT